MLTSDFLKLVFRKSIQVFKNGHFKNVQNSFSFLLFGKNISTFGKGKKYDAIIFHYI